MSPLYKEQVSSFNGRYYIFGLGEVFGDSLLPIGQDRPEPIRLRKTKKIPTSEDKAQWRPKHKIHLFDLPAEIRNTIYSHLFDGDDKVDCFFKYVTCEPEYLSLLEHPLKREYLATVRLPLQIKHIFVSKKFVNEAAAFVADNHPITLLAVSTFRLHYSQDLESCGMFSAHKRKGFVQQFLADMCIHAKHIKTSDYHPYWKPVLVWPAHKHDGTEEDLQALRYAAWETDLTRHGHGCWTVMKIFENLRILTLEIRDYWWNCWRPGCYRLALAVERDSMMPNPLVYTLFQYEQDEISKGIVPTSLSDILQLVLSEKMAESSLEGENEEQQLVSMSFKLPAHELHDLHLGSALDRIEVRYHIRLLCLAAIVRKDQRIIDGTPAIIEVEADYKTGKVHKMSWTVDETRKITESYSF